MSEKYKKTYKYLDYVEHFLILVSTVSSCVSFSVFASLVAIPVGVTSSAVGIKFVQLLQESKTVKSIMKKKKRKHKK